MNAKDFIPGKIYHIPGKGCALLFLRFCGIPEAHKFESWAQSLRWMEILENYGTIRQCFSRSNDWEEL